MRSWSRIGLAALVVALAGCFETPPVDCTLTCASGCPSGFHCVDDRCRPNGVEAACSAEDRLEGEHLLVRYHLDEAGSGTEPASLVDRAPSPLDLSILYAGQSHFTGEAGKRGLYFTAADADGRARSAVADTKLLQLAGRQQATIEVVVDIEALGTTQSRLTHIGAGSDPGDFTLQAQIENDTERVQFVWQGHTVVADWRLDLTGSDRQVLHLVLDGRREGRDRASLYIDGVWQQPTPSVGTPVGDEESITFSEDSTAETYFALGNRGSGGRSFQGTLFYAAIYLSALDEQQVLSNAVELSNDDDRPR